MTKILMSLLIAAAMSCSVMAAQGNLRVSKENCHKPVAIAVHGKTGCVMVDGGIFCAPAIIRTPDKFVSTLPN